MADQTAFPPDDRQNRSAPVSRRSFLASVAAATSLPSSFSFAAEAADAGDEQPAFDFRLPCLGKIKPVPSQQIKSSPMSVGFEVLDRQRFDPTKTYRHLAALGVKWARCQTGWNRCERTRGEFTFGWLDEVIDSLLEIGVQPWFNLGYGNKLYTPAKPDDMSVGWAPVFDAEASKAWVRFVGKLAEHFADRVTYWEIWNEPNIKAFWKPNKPDAAKYVELVKFTAPEIRSRVQNSVIIGGATAGIPMSYIEECFEAGLADLIDRFSYHPYRAMPEKNYEPEIRRLRELVAQYNTKIRLWQGENGSPSKGGKESSGAMTNLDWNENRQAKWLLRRILSDLRLDIELTSYFHTVDLVGYRGKTNFKGLLRGNEYTPKPSYYAFQCLCALFDSATKHLDVVPELIDQGRERLQDAVFVRDGRLIYTWWFPADLFEPFTPRTIDVQMPLPAATSLKDAVLIDPFTHNVYSYPRAKVTDGKLRLSELPLLDYPLMVTDRATAGV